MPLVAVIFKFCKLTECCLLKEWNASGVLDRGGADVEYRGKKGGNAGYRWLNSGISVKKG